MKTVKACLNKMCEKLLNQNMTEVTHYSTNYLVSLLFQLCQLLMKKKCGYNPVAATLAKCDKNSFSQPSADMNIYRFLECKEFFLSRKEERLFEKMLETDRRQVWRKRLFNNIGFDQGYSVSTQKSSESNLIQNLVSSPNSTTNSTVSNSDSRNPTPHPYSLRYHSISNGITTIKISRAVKLIEKTFNSNFIQK